MKKIYFCGSISGGREKAVDYQKMMDNCKKVGVVLTEHVADEVLEVKNGQRFYSDVPEIQTYLRDVDWIREADFVIADISVPSIGVGYEIGFAESIEKPILCIYDKNSAKTASMMITGNQNIMFREYETVEEANRIIDEFMEI